MLLNPDFEDFIHHLNAAKVRYLVVGAYAVIIYTEPRYTKDIDFLIDATPENTGKVYEALEQFGAPLHNLTAEDLCKPDMVLQVGVEPNRIDVLTGIKGFSFNQLWNHRRYNRYGKEKIPLVGTKDLIQMKKAAGRPKDLEDIQLLELAMKKAK